MGYYKTGQTEIINDKMTIIYYELESKKFSIKE